MSGKMKAALFHKVNEPLRIEEISIPKPGPDDVLVKIKATGICGSDIHIVYEGVTPTGFLPITLGHEPCGVVAEVGKNVDKWKEGDRVVVNPIVTCNECNNCLRGRESLCTRRRFLGIHLNGGLAEYMVAPQGNLVFLPDNVPFDQGAICTDAVATPFHGLVTLGKIKLGESVAVIGLGGLGLHAIQLARLAGAAKIIAIGRTPSVIQRAVECGAHHGINITEGNPQQQVKALTKEGGVDLAIELVGTQDMVALGVECLRPGGRLVVAGLGAEPIRTLPPTLFVRQEFTIMGSYAWNQLEVETILQLVSSGHLDISQSVSKRFELENVNIALENLRDRVGRPVRFVIVQE